MIKYLILFICFVVFYYKSIKYLNRSLKFYVGIKLYKPGSYLIGQLQIGNVKFIGVNAGVYSELSESLYKKSARVGVYGNAFDNYTKEDLGILNFDEVMYKAQLIGELIAGNGLIFVNGACAGLPNNAAHGARTKNGIVTGFSPLENEANHLSIYGWDKGKISHTLIAYLGPKNNGSTGIELSKRFVTRDLASIFSSDAIIVIGGAYGTNHEVAIAAELGLPIMLLKGTGGVADNAKQYYESIRKPNNSAVFIEDEYPKLLVEKMLEELYRRGKLSRQFNPGKDPLDTVIQRIERQQMR